LGDGGIGASGVPFAGYYQIARVYLFVQAGSTSRSVVKSVVSPVAVRGREHLPQPRRCGTGTIKQRKGRGGLMGALHMSDNDRLDRMERKLNRIGKYVLLGIALFTVLLVLEMQKATTDLFFGYGRLAVWSFVGVMTVILLVARAPFRD
jgi:hypothetical protein